MIENVNNSVLPPYCTMREDIVISGISGIFPDSYDMNELAKNLYDGVNCVTGSYPRWPPGYLGLPKLMGNIPSDLSEFDGDFFGYNLDEVNVLDFQTRFMLERTHSAILDAGVDPETLRDTKTGFFLASSVDETNLLFMDISNKLGAIQFQAERVPHAFHFHGPVASVDIACGSSITALHQAMVALRTGQCDSAIVAAVNICVYPGTAMMFHDLSMTSQECKCKAFDASADGYARSEALAVIFLQKKSHAKRIYAILKHTKANADGYKPEGITFPKAETQTKLIKQTYAECGIDPLTVKYMESHTTGTKAGDPIECKAMSMAMRQGKHKEIGPLLVGALKTNIGHSEAASGLCAIAKVIISYENKMIPKNLHCNVLNPDIPELHDGSLLPITENTPFEGGIVSVNNFGFGGANAHLIMDSPNIEPKDESFKIADKIPRLLLMCGRTEESVEHIFKYVQSNRSVINREFLGLLNDISYQPRRKYRGMPYRGAMILHEDQQNEPPFNVEETYTNEERRPLWYIFTGMGCQWPEMGKSLMSCEIFKNTIDRLARVIQSYGIDLVKLLTSNDDPLLSRPIGCFVSIAAVQIAFVNLLQHLGLTPDGIIGHSIGEIGCAYADGALTEDETILAAYFRGKSVEDSVPNNCIMAAVGLSWDEIKNKCPSGITVSCNNSADSVTVSGSDKIVKEFMTNLRNENIFVKKVDSCGIPFHSSMMNPIVPSLTKALQSIGIKSKPRTERWISTSADDDSALSDVEYYVNNLIKPVKFYEAISRIPENACVIELSPHSLFSSAIKSTVNFDAKFISMMRKNGTIDNVLLAIGELYKSGYDPRIERLYPKVQYPVPRGTPFISPLIKWDYTNKYYVPDYESYCVEGEKTRKTWRIKLRDREHESLSGHMIEGRVLYPGTGYLMLVWKTLANLIGVTFDRLPIQFENISFKRATIMSKDREVTFDVYYFVESGNFEIVESEQICVSGRVMVPNLRDPMGVLKFGDVFNEGIKKFRNNKNEMLIMQSKDVYKELRLRGYDYGPTFQGIQSATSDGCYGKVKWSGDWIAFADAMLQIGILSKSHRGLCLPTTIELLRCDPRLMHLGNDERIVDVVYDPNTNIGSAAGIEIRGMRASPAPRKTTGNETLERYIFVPYDEKFAIDNNTKQKIEEYIDACQKVASNIEMRLRKPVKVPSNNNNNNNVNVKKYLSSDLNEHTMIKILDEVNSYQNTSVTDHWQILGKIITDNKKKLIEDIVINCSVNCVRMLHPLICIIADNYHARPFNILEMNSGGHVLTPYIIERIRIHSFGLKYKVTIAYPDNDFILDIPHTYVLLSPTNFKMGITGDEIEPSTYGCVVFRDNSLCCIGEEANVDPQLALEQVYAAVEDNGFILAFLKYKALPFDYLLCSQFIDYPKRCTNFMLKAEKMGLLIVCKKLDGISTMAILLRKPPKVPITKRHFIVVNNEHFDWVNQYNKVKSKLAPNEKIWLLANETHTGVLGMVMTLRKEPGGEHIRCVYNEQMKNITIPPEILQLDLQQNVYHEGKWGQMRHIDYDENDMTLKPAKHAYINVKNKGDLSSFSWFEASHKYWPYTRKYNETLVDVYYAPLNFRDIMCASGRLSADAIPGGLNIEDGILGLEFSGRDENSNRVMGMVAGRGMATTVVVPDPDFLWQIPENWSMEEASTVPCVYSTSYYALLIRGKLKKGESVLIHSGSGGVGLSAIAICLSMSCEVFTTVGTQKKRDFIKKQFPQLKDDHIFNSRDTKFESQILLMTNGRGVDIVLNSLSEEKLLASIRCLAANGRFCEIGKFDLSMNNPLDLSSLIQNKTFHGILLDAFFDHENLPPLLRAQKKMLQKYLIDGIANGVVKPLNRTIFDKEHVEDAFRFMSTGKHIGKVILKIRDENNRQNETLTVMAIPRTFIHPNKSVLITGGLGGFGLEMAQWFVEHGTRKLILTSRNGPKEPYQHYALKRMRRMGANVKIWIGNGESEKELEDMMKAAIELGPIGAIFHLATIFNDALMENQTAENFLDSTIVKIGQAHHLDKLSRIMCPQLDYFVIFSSIVSGKGNAGQANYAFGNSACERICESRHRDGLHGLAIQWGAIGDVGFVAEIMKASSIAGTLLQRMPSCFAILDRFLQSEGPVLGSCIREDEGMKSSGNSNNLIAQIAHILGINDLSKVNPKTRLVDVGMDSLMGVEIKLTLEKDYNINLNTQEIRNLTLQDLINCQKTTLSPNAESSQNNNSVVTEDMSIDLMVLPEDLTVHLNSVSIGKPIFVLPSSEEQFNLLVPVAQKIMRPVYGLNWTEGFNKLSSISQVAAKWLQLIEKIEPNAEYDIMGYSFGGAVAYEMAIQIQNRGRKIKNLIMLDSSPQLMAAYGAAAKGQYDSTDEGKAHIEALLGFIIRLARINYDDTKKQLNECKTFDERYAIAAKLLNSNGLNLSEKKIVALLEAYWVKANVAEKYQISDKYNGNAILIRASDSKVIKNCDIASENDYGMSKAITGKCDVTIFNGNHKSFISNNVDLLSEIINKLR